MARFTIDPSAADSVNFPLIPEGMDLMEALRNDNNVVWYSMHLEIDKSLGGFDINNREKVKLAAEKGYTFTGTKGRITIIDPARPKLKPKL